MFGSEYGGFQGEWGSEAGTSRPSWKFSARQRRRRLYAQRPEDLGLDEKRHGNEETEADEPSQMETVEKVDRCERNTMEKASAMPGPVQDKKDPSS